MPSDWDCTIRDEDWIERSRSGEPLFVPEESLVGVSSTVGSTQCSNIRRFIVQGDGSRGRALERVVKGESDQERSVDDERIRFYTINQTDSALVASSCCFLWRVFVIKHADWNKALGSELVFGSNWGLHDPQNTLGYYRMSHNHAWLWHNACQVKASCNDMVVGKTGSVLKMTRDDG